MSDELNEVELKVMALVTTGGGNFVPLYLRQRLGLTVEQINHTRQILVDKDLISPQPHQLLQTGLNRRPEFFHWIEVIMQPDDDNARDNDTGTQNNVGQDQFNAAGDQFINSTVHVHQMDKPRRGQKTPTSLTTAQETALLKIATYGAHAIGNPFNDHSARNVGVSSSMIATLHAMGMLRDTWPPLISEKGWTVVEVIKKNRGLEL